MSDVSKVLIVAESDFHLDLMSDLLEANGLRAVRATSSQEAIRCAQKFRPAMVVVDVALSQNGSRKILESLRSRAATRDIPVLAVADPRMAQEAQRVANQSYTACVEKPISTSQFTRSVMREMHRSTTAVQ